MARPKEPTDEQRGRAELILTRPTPPPDLGDETPEQLAVYWGNVDLTRITSAARRALLREKIEQGTLDAYRCLHWITNAKAAKPADRIRAARTLLEVAGVLTKGGKAAEKPTGKDGKVQIPLEAYDREPLVKHLRNLTDQQRDELFLQASASGRSAPPLPEMLAVGSEDV